MRVVHRHRDYDGLDDRDEHADGLGLFNRDFVSIDVGGTIVSRRKG